MVHQTVLSTQKYRGCVFWWDCSCYTDLGPQSVWPCAVCVETGGHEENHCRLELGIKSLGAPSSSQKGVLRAVLGRVAYRGIQSE